MKNDNESLARIESGPTALPQPTPADMLRAVIEKGLTAESVGAMEKLCDLYERMETRNSERAFAEAFNALQGDLPTIVAKTQIQNRGKYERFEDIMEVVGPLLTKHGFTVSFSMDFKENRVLETCHLTHVGGHVRSNSFAVRTGRADTETQADCKAATTAKRMAFMNALNIVIRQDALTSENDASLEGAYITQDRAEDLERRARLLNMNIQQFLALAGADKFTEISTAKADVLENVLAAREKRGH